MGEVKTPESSLHRPLLGFTDHWALVETLLECVHACVHSCLTLYDPMDYKPQGASVHEILQAGILE